MAVVGLVVHHQRSEARDLARELAAWLVGAGHIVRVPDEDASVAGLEAHAVDPGELTAGLDVIVSLGGDGTILRTVGLLASVPVPIVGINFGQLGYLAEVEPANARSCLEQVLGGSFRCDDRMLLSVDVRGSDGELRRRDWALNEAVLERHSSGHTIRVEVAFDDVPFTPYEADALIVATPTGSTAYAFSARGPIIEPSHRALLLTPVSPHMLFDRSLVLDATTRVTLTVAGHRTAVLSVDGRVVDDVEPGAEVVCAGSEQVVRLVTVQPRHFHAILKAKFGLNDR